MDFITANWQQLLMLLLGINLAAFSMFGLDKLFARVGAWRISERTLLALALIGGSAGVFAARFLFRHKTRKQPFNTDLKIVVIIQFVLLFSFLAYLVLAPDSRQF